MSAPEPSSEVYNKARQAAADRLRRSYQVKSGTSDSVPPKRPAAFLPADALSKKGRTTVLPADSLYTPTLSTVNKRSDSNRNPQANAHQKPLERDARLGTYFEYDLSTLKNTNGGFLIDQSDPLHTLSSANSNERSAQVIEAEKRRELERLTKQSRIRHQSAFDPPLYPGGQLAFSQPTCVVCKSIEIDQTFRNVFGVNVCNACKNTYPDRFSLLTKTECKEDYLLTDRGSDAHLIHIPSDLNV